MIAKHFAEMTQAKSMIRVLSEFATERAKEVGKENVFDFSLGNPSVPLPQEVTDNMIKILQTSEPLAIHGYSPSLGLPEVRAKVAASLSKRFGIPYTADEIFMTSGAAGAIAHAVRAVVEPGEEVLTFAPCFSEYFPYVNGTGAKLKLVPANTKNFQINIEAFEEMLNENVAAVLINTPNNPSGVVYNTETVKTLAGILKKKSEEYGHDIYIISDEPYREIVFEGVDAPCVSTFYDNTIMCYSFSKSLSLPGERIGYVAVNPACKDAKLIVVMCGQISRETGHNCPASMSQLMVADYLDTTADLSVYETNKKLLFACFKELGFECVEPGGTFYIFPKALEEDASKFCEKARKYDLIFVPGDGFGVPGYFRLAYCVETETVERAIPVIKKFVETEYPNR